MKKLLKSLFYFPFILGCVFYGLIAIFGGIYMIHPVVWIAILFLLLSGIFLRKEKLWGAIFGILVGVVLIYMGTRETGQIIKETPFGIFLCIYYIVCTIVAYIMSKKA